MKIGVCRGFDDFFSIKVAAEAGADYIETGFAGLVNAEDAKIDFCGDFLKQYNMPCYSANCFIPGSLKVTGETVDYAALDEYITKGFVNGEKLGLKTVVFGSSGARNVPEGFPAEKAKEQMAYFLKEYAGPRAKEHGIIIAIEPLSTKDTNIIFTMAEAAEIAKMSGAENVFALGDLYHMCYNNDEVANVYTLGGAVRHAHIAEPSKRKFPSRSDDAKYIAMYGEFLKALEKTGCTHCSIEAGTDAFSKEAGEAIALLKECANS